MTENTKESIGTTIFGTLFIIGVQYFLLRFTHWSLALLATCLMTIVITYVYLSLKSASEGYGNITRDGKLDFGKKDYTSIKIILVVFVSLLSSLAVIAYLM